MHFDPTISIGNIITIAGLVIAACLWIVRTTTAIDRLNDSIKGMTEKFTAFTLESKGDRLALHKQLDGLDRKGCELAGLCDLTSPRPRKSKGDWLE